MTREAKVTQKAVLDEMTATEGCEYFSGYSSIHNHPILMASGEGFTVLANGFRRRFKLDEFDMAVSAYKAAMKKNGY